jgi:hypothetical protein
MTQTWQKVALLTGLTLAASTIHTDIAEAATLAYNFSVDVTSGTLAGQTFSGSFFVDNSKLTGIGTERLNPSNNGLSISFNFNGTSLTAADDGNYPNLPFVEFDNGSLIGLNWLPEVNSIPILAIASSVSADGGAFINDPLGGGNQFAYDLSAVGGSGTGTGSVTYTATAVPTPSTTAGLITIGLLGVWRKSRQKQRVMKWADQIGQPQNE